MTDSEDYEYDYSDDDNYQAGSDDDEEEQGMDWHPSQDAENPNAAPMIVVKSKLFSISAVSAVESYSSIYQRRP
jgi:hypothetical protein